MCLIVHSLSCACELTAWCAQSCRLQLHRFGLLLKYVKAAYDIICNTVE